MAPSQSRVIQPEDLKRAVRSIATIFNTEEVIIVGSQALLVARDDLPRELRMSEEFDAYPKNYKEWEQANPGELASEAIFALIGDGSIFHKTHGFFVDGIDEATAKLPPDWRTRAVSRDIDVGDRIVKVVAPEPNDLVASKLTRGEPKDIVFTRLCLRQGLVKHDQLRNRLEVLLTGEQLSQGLLRLAHATRGSKSPGAEEEQTVPR